MSNLEFGGREMSETTRSNQPGTAERAPRLSDDYRYDTELFYTRRQMDEAILAERRASEVRRVLLRRKDNLDYALAIVQVIRALDGTTVVTR